MLPKYNQLCMEPNSFMTGSSISFLLYMWVVVVFSPILFIFCYLLFISHNETHIPADAIAPVRNHCSGSKKERREKKQVWRGGLWVLLRKKCSDCFQQELEAFAVMVREEFAIKVIRNWKVILVEILSRGSISIFSQLMWPRMSSVLRNILN